MKHLLALIGGLVLSLAASAQSCPFWQVITFADGQEACISDYPFSKETPGGFNQTVKNLVPNTSFIAVARTHGGAQCPAVTGVGLGSTGLQHGSPDGPRARVEKAIRSCEAALSKLKASQDCRCQLLLSEGRSPLSKAQFDRAAGNDPASAAALSGKPTQTPVIPPAPVTAAPRSDSAKAPVSVLPQRPTTITAPPAAESSRAVPRFSARALVIGNGRYASFGVLQNPARDARAIARKLESFGIEVDLVIDADRDQLIHALNEHSGKARGTDVSLFFYAGHGVQVEGINYLIPVNMRADGVSAGYVKLAGIALNAVLDYLPAKTRIIFLDACRDNPVARSLLGTRGGGGVGLAAVNVAGGTMIAYATRDGATAEDGGGQNSPYTAALLQHLDAPTDISLTLRQVRQTVLKLTSGRQEPWEYGSLIGEQIVLPLMARK